MQNSHIHCKNLFANKESVSYKEPTIFVEFFNVPFRALAGFHTRYSIFRLNWNLEMLVFVEGGKLVKLEKSP